MSRSSRVRFNSLLCGRPLLEAFWEFSKNTPNELGKWYIKLTKENDPISKLKVSGEQPEYFIGLDFYVKDNIKGTEWTKVSDGSNMGIDNFNKI